MQDTKVACMRTYNDNRGYRGIWLYFFRYNRLPCDLLPANLNRTLLIAVPGGAASARIADLILDHLA